MSEIKISETFKSIQGEGRLVGVVSVFLRISNCNLSCAWCDSRPAAKGQGKVLCVPALIDKALAYKCKNVVITGGEPMLCSAIGELTRGLKAAGCHITIETNATLIKDVACDLMSMSPKLSHSVPSDLSPYQQRHYNKRRLNLAAIRHYMKSFDYQLKFVVHSAADFSEIESVLRTLGNVDPFKVLVMPLARTKKQLHAVQKDIIAACIDTGRRYADRLQLQVWGRRNGM